MKINNQLIVTVILQFLLMSCVPTSNHFGNKKTVFSLRDWKNSNETFKYELINNYIKVAKEDHVTMKLPPKYYIQEIDLLIDNSIKNGDANSLEQSLGITIKTIAIMDNDWDNGKNKINYAKEFMGPINFEDFANRYPEKYNKLKQESQNN